MEKGMFESCCNGEEVFVFFVGIILFVCFLVGEVGIFKVIYMV